MWKRVVLEDEVATFSELFNKIVDKIHLRISLDSHFSAFFSSHLDTINKLIILQNSMLQICKYMLGIN